MSNDKDKKAFQEFKKALESGEFRDSGISHGITPHYGIFSMPIVESVFVPKDTIIMANPKEIAKLSNSFKDSSGDSVWGSVKAPSPNSGSGSAATAKQPAPVSGIKSMPVTAEVVRDLQDRSAEGKVKYGTALETHNGRDALVDAYQEVLDLAQYIKQELMERGDLRKTIERQRQDINDLRKWNGAQATTIGGQEKDLGTAQMENLQLREKLERLETCNKNQAEMLGTAWKEIDELKKGSTGELTRQLEEQKRLVYFWRAQCGVEHRRTDDANRRADAAEEARHAANSRNTDFARDVLTLSGETERLKRELAEHRSAHSETITARVSVGDWHAKSMITLELVKEKDIDVAREFARQLVLSLRDEMDKTGKTYRLSLEEAEIALFLVRNELHQRLPDEGSDGAGSLFYPNIPGLRTVRSKLADFIKRNQ